MQGNSRLLGTKTPAAEKKIFSGLLFAPFLRVVQLKTLCQSLLYPFFADFWSSRLYRICILFTGGGDGLETNLSDHSVEHGKAELLRQWRSSKNQPLTPLHRKAGQLR